MRTGFNGSARSWRAFDRIIVGRASHPWDSDGGRRARRTGSWWIAFVQDRARECQFSLSVWIATRSRRKRAWHSELGATNQLPREIREVFEKTSYGCLAAETNIGIVHVCHASDADIEEFRDKPILYQWQLIKMPTAPLVRLDMTVVDRPEDPYRFESFSNVTAEDQAQVLAELANQEKLHLAFYGDERIRVCVTFVDGGK
jgi:hypothetical protein